MVVFSYKKLQLRIRFLEKKSDKPGKLPHFGNFLKRFTWRVDSNKMKASLLLFFFYRDTSKL